MQYRLAAQIREAQNRTDQLDLNRGETSFQPKIDSEITFPCKVIDNWQAQICETFEDLSKKMSQIESRLDQIDLIMGQILAN